MNRDLKGSQPGVQVTGIMEAWFIPRPDKLCFSLPHTVLRIGCFAFRMRVRFETETLGSRLWDRLATSQFHYLLFWAPLGE